MRLAVPVLALLILAPMMSGCVVAAAPVLAGGLIARGAVDKHAHDGAPATPAPTASAAPTLAAMPADSTRMIPNQPYAGALPGGALAAGAAAPGAADQPGEAAATPPMAGPSHDAGDGGGWPALVRFVAINKVTVRHSALLMRGGVLTDPHWVPCATKPRAVLLPASLIADGGGGDPRLTERDLGWIVALPTIGTTIILVAANPAEAAAARTTFARAGLAKPVAGDTLMMAPNEADLPAVRAAVGARYCVVAVAGRRAADFPNALLPASTPSTLADQWRAGWFLFGAGAR